MQPKIKTDNNNNKKKDNNNNKKKGQQPHGLMGSLGFHASGQKYTISKPKGQSLSTLLLISFPLGQHAASLQPPWHHLLLTPPFLIPIFTSPTDKENHNPSTYHTTPRQHYGFLCV